MMFRTLFVAAIVAFALVNTSAAAPEPGPEPEPEPAAEPGPEPEPEPTGTPTSGPTGTPTPGPTRTPTPAPTGKPTSAPTTDAEPEPEPEPEPAATTQPTTQPTTPPTTPPTTQPTAASTNAPTNATTGDVFGPGGGSNTSSGNTSSGNTSSPTSNSTTTTETTTVTIAAVEYAFDAAVGAKFAALSVADLARDNKALGLQLMGVMGIDVAAYNEVLSGMQKNGALIVGSRRRRADTYSFKVAIDTAMVSLAQVNSAIATANSGTLPVITVSVGGEKVTYQVPTIPTAVQETAVVAVTSNPTPAATAAPTTAPTAAPTTAPTPAPTPAPTAGLAADSATSVTVGWVTVLALALAQLL